MLISVYKSKIYSHKLRFFSKLLIIEVKLHVINSYTGQIQACETSRAKPLCILGYPKASETVFSVKRQW